MFPEMTKRQNRNKTKKQSNKIQDKIRMKSQLKHDNNMSQETGSLEYYSSSSYKTEKLDTQFNSYCLIYSIAPEGN